jgi:DNA-binding response OmpR family regulator
MKKMLIIEDDVVVGNIYRHKFQKEGFAVTVAADGESGLKLLRQSKPDVVVLDLMLPKLNGVEILKAMRAEPQTQLIPVIVLTNTYLSGLVQEAWKAGANQCMIKASCTPKQLVAVVHKTLNTGPAAPSPATEADSATTHLQPSHSPPAAASPSELPMPSEDETAFQAELRQAFLHNAPDQLAELRSMLQAFIKSEGDSVRLPRLFALYRQVHSLTSNAAVSGLPSVAKMASALEALLKELYEKPKTINASTLRTVAHTIDFLALLAQQASTTDTIRFSVPNIMVVDDEAISRRAVIYALEKAHLKCVSVEDPNVALTMLSENQFDLIFLDVDMPGMNGFDLCTKLRALPAHARTPVVFVTGLTDFESRARSTLSGGSDLIAKPFLFMELAVKALTHVLKGQCEVTRP